MLTICPLGSRAGPYYFANRELSLVGGALAGARSVGTGTAPDRWIGGGARRLGLAGGVDAADLAALIGWRHPATGELVGSARSRGQVVNAAYDAVFAAPKSVSLMMSTGDRDLAASVRRAHDIAVERGFAYLERHGSAVVRRSRGEARYLDSTGFAAATFAHGTSRALDPHLHTHAVFANLAHGSDGNWSAFHSGFIWGAARTAGYVYQAELRHELSRDLGIAWKPVRNGVAEIDGVPAPVIAEFSRRAQVIAESTAGEASPDGARRRRFVQLATREPVSPGIDVEALAASWRGRCGCAGLDPESWPAITGRQGPPEIDTAAARLVEVRVARSPAVRKSPWTLERAAVRIALDLAPGGCDPRGVFEVVGRAVSSRLVEASRELPPEIALRSVRDGSRAAVPGPGAGALVPNRAVHSIAGDTARTRIRAGRAVIGRDDGIGL